MGAVAPVLGIASSFLSNKQAKKQQRKEEEALQLQNQQQAQAQKDALVQQKKSQRATESAVRKSPDVSSLLAQNTGDELGSSMLTGSMGVDQNKLKLGKKSLLGG